MLGVRLDVPFEVRADARYEDQVAVGHNRAEQRRVRRRLAAAPVHFLRRQCGRAC